MDLHNLKTSIKQPLRRKGQGHGSGRGKTGGRGQKGQLARSKVALRFEGGALPLTKRMPLLRGKEKNKSFRPEYLVLPLTILASLKKDTIVDRELLLKEKLISSKDSTRSIKLTGVGEIAQALQIKLKTTSSAREKIEKAGGVILS